MMRRLVIAALVAAALVVAGAAGAVALFRAYPVRMSLFAAMTRNYLRSLSAPKGATTTELNPAYKGAAPPSPSSAAASGADEDWPSYNRTLTSERYAPVAEINASTVGKLKVLCTYDTHQYTGFNSGLLMVDGALLFATEHDTYSIDPITCGEKWHKHETYAPGTPQAVNRGVAFLDGRVFRARILKRTQEFHGAAQSWRDYAREFLDGVCGQFARTASRALD